MMTTGGCQRQSRDEEPELAASYPSAGGRLPSDERLLWSRFRSALVEHGEAIRPWLDHAPQTNEVGRGAALAGGLAFLAAESALPVRLVEVGASAGVDLAPVDPTEEAGRPRLKAFGWADQVNRHARLDAACQVAAQVPALGVPAVPRR